MKTAKMVDHEAKVGSINQFTTLQTAKSDELNSDTSLKTETQVSFYKFLVTICLPQRFGPSILSVFLFSSSSFFSFASSCLWL